MKFILWQYAIGPENDGYRLTCHVDEDIQTGRSTVTIVENGRELHRQDFIDDGRDPDAWRKPTDFGELMRLRYFGHAMDRMRPIYQRLRGA